MSHAARQYAATARSGMSPRETEASALLKAAARLQAAREQESPGAAPFAAALDHNRRLWTILLASVGDPASPLPSALRGNVLILANFVLNHSLAVTAEPAADKLDCLIAINRELAAGLRALP